MNNKNPLTDKLGEIDAKYLDEYYHRRNRRDAKRKNIMKYCSIAASVVLVAAISIAALSPMFRKDPINAPSDTAQNIPDTDITEATPTDPEPDTDNEIVFAGNLSGNNVEGEVEGGGFPDNLYDPDSGTSLLFDSLLTNALKTAADDTVLAFTVSIINGEPADDSPQLHAELNEAYSVFTEAVEECIIELMNERGISRIEADARKFRYPEYISAREAYIEANKKYNAAQIASFYNKNKAAFTALSDLGFTVLYDATNEKYQPYLHRLGALGVMTATKAQLMELKDKEFSNEYYLGAAAENAEEFSISVSYDGWRVNLADDSKLTDELIAAYEKANGKALRVRCKIAYFGKEYTEREDAHQAALAAIGMTQEEFDNCNDPEVYDKYSSEKRRIVQHRDHNDEAVDKLLNSGELTDSEYVEMEYYNYGFIAELTYERALELCENGEIAYIEAISTEGDGIWGELEWVNE